MFSKNVENIKKVCVLDEFRGPLKRVGLCLRFFEILKKPSKFCPQKISLSSPAHDYRKTDPDVKNLLVILIRFNVKFFSGFFLKGFVVKTDDL
jgi:hypothetical protein